MRTANALASNGTEWGEYMRYNNSGTYNNQYMVIDLKLFTPGQQLVEGLLTIVEQVGSSYSTLMMLDDADDGFEDSGLGDVC